ncbi:hypothetical protein LIER_05120 [Lithospermum erythrorhizon]|uniref:Integrase catalytic domain-containing protein n=1 Tax=Lithospermum erythrorhizon TaxID=34254 RepID=A0AAV3P421_LITER
MSLNRMFPLKTEKSKELEGECLQTSSENSIMLWHQRYGHLNFQGLKTLKNKEMVIGLPRFDNQEITCTNCLSEKQTRHPMPKQCKWKADKVLEKGWVYLLVNKSEALSCFKKFKNMVEKESGEQLTTAYTTQQNGVVERRNRKIMNMMRSMLSTKEMPKYLWTEAVVWTTYVLNRCPTLSVKDETPLEAWSGTKPTVEDFKVWGYVTHAHIPKIQRRKLDKRSAVCVFLGMSTGTKGYMLYNTKTKKIIISRDVVFEESKTWDWNKDGASKESEELRWEDDDINEATENQNAMNNTTVEE